MKTFKDLEFKPNPVDPLMGISSRIYFDNGYGVSVAKGMYTYGGKDGLYELAVLDSKGEIDYTTSITNDVIGYLRPEDVTDVMVKVQQLVKPTNSVTSDNYNEDGYFSN